MRRRSRCRNNKKTRNCQRSAYLERLALVGVQSGLALQPWQRHEAVDVDAVFVHVPGKTREDVPSTEQAASSSYDGLLRAEVLRKTTVVVESGTPTCINKAFQRYVVRPAASAAVVLLCESYANGEFPNPQVMIFEHETLFSHMKTICTHMGGKVRKLFVLHMTGHKGRTAANNKNGG